MDFKRIFSMKAFQTRVFTVVRLVFLIIGAGVASVYTMTGGNVSAALMFACIAYIAFRYGQIKGYIK